MKQWYINNMSCIPKDGDLTNFVISVRWSRNATEIINEKKYFASVNGDQLFTTENVTNFIPYDELTYDIVCGWLNSSIDVTNLDANLDQQIAIQVDPPIVTPPLPFTNP